MYNKLLLASLMILHLGSCTYEKPKLSISLCFYYDKNYVQDINLEQCINEMVGYSSGELKRLIQVGIQDTQFRNTTFDSQSITEIEKDFGKQYLENFLKSNGVNDIPVFVVPSTLRSMITFQTKGGMFILLPYNELCDQNKKSMFLHELCHIFGAPDINIKDHLMNSHTAALLQINHLDDGHILALMQLARDSMIAQGSNHFNLAAAQPEYAEPIIQHLMQFKNEFQYPYIV